MGSCWRGCSNPPYTDACNLNGPREELCEVCLTYLVRLERPANWTPRVKKADPELTSAPNK
jgi:hypothetical protein